MVSNGRSVLYVAEPSASYRVRTPLVVDCSVLVAVLFEEETYERAVELIGGKNLFAPGLLTHEIVHVALEKRRLGLAVDEIAQVFSDYANYAIGLRQTESLAQCELAQRYNLSGHDAAYLWLAAELKAPLATFDKNWLMRLPPIWLAWRKSPDHCRHPLRQRAHQLIAHRTCCKRYLVDRQHCAI